MNIEIIKKRGRGRPKKEEPTTALNFRIENDLLLWADKNKGELSRTQFINDLIRKGKQTWKKH